MIGIHYAYFSYFSIFFVLHINLIIVFKHTIMQLIFPVSLVTISLVQLLKCIKCNTKTIGYGVFKYLCKITSKHPLKILVKFSMDCQYQKKIFKKIRHTSDTNIINLFKNI